MAIVKPQYASRRFPSVEDCRTATGAMGKKCAYYVPMYLFDFQVFVHETCLDGVGRLITKLDDKWKCEPGVEPEIIVCDQEPPSTSPGQIPSEAQDGAKQNDQCLHPSAKAWDG